MQYPKRFFDISWQFAVKTASVSHRPLADVLLDHTNLYIRFELGREFNPANDVWRKYLHGLDQAADPIEWTYQFYLQRQAAASSSLNEPTFGCFSYSLLSQQRIRLHFHNNDPFEYSPLSAERRSIRLTELAAMLGHIKTQVKGPTTIVGSSWLYNLGAYRQLFPVEYLAAARAAKGECAFLTIWGQFINRFGQIKENLAAQFLTRLYDVSDQTQLEDCFPYPVLHTECPIQTFFNFYQV